MADQRHRKGAVAAKERMTEQIKLLSVSVAELNEKVVKGNEAVADLKIKLQGAERQTEGVSYEKDGL